LIAALTRAGRLLGSSGLMATLIAATAIADSDAGRPLWIPSLALGAGAQSQSADGFATTSLRGPTSGGESFLTESFDVRLELQTPTLDFLPGTPRLFVHGGWQYGWLAFDDTRTVTKEGDVGEIIPPLGSNLPELVLGQGTSLKARVDNGWFAGIGLAFEVPWRQYPFRIKPSIDYYGERVEVGGVVQNAFLITPGVFFPPQDFEPAVFGVDRAVASAEGTLHGLGPRVQIEADVGAIGPLVLSVFVDVAAY